MYGSAFCRVYNEFGWNTYPEVFAEQLWVWLEQNGVKAQTALDLGCGTGVLCQCLKERGVRAAGVDLSEGMIDIARGRAPEIPFAAANMITYRPEERFDLVTCTGDAINHIFDPADVGRVFKNVFSYLKDGGYFIFDLLRDTEVPTGEPFELDYSDSVKARFLTTREESGVINLNISVFENGKLQTEENIREIVHDRSMICALLRDAGFDVVQFADRLLLDTDSHGTTWFVIAKKPEPLSL